MNLNKVYKENPFKTSLFKQEFDELNKLCSEYESSLLLRQTVYVLIDIFTLSKIYPDKLAGCKQVLKDKYEKQIKILFDGEAKKKQNVVIKLAKDILKDNSIHVEDLSDEYIANFREQYLVKTEEAIKDLEEKVISQSKKVVDIIMPFGSDKAKALLQYLFIFTGTQKIYETLNVYKLNNYQSILKQIISYGLINVKNADDNIITQSFMPESEEEAKQICEDALKAIRRVSYKYNRKISVDKILVSMNKLKNAKLFDGCYQDSPAI